MIINKTINLNEMKQTTMIHPKHIERIDLDRYNIIKLLINIHQTNTSERNLFLAET